MKRSWKRDVFFWKGQRANTHCISSLFFISTPLQRHQYADYIHSFHFNHKFLTLKHHLQRFLRERVEFPLNHNVTTLLFFSGPWKPCFAWAACWLAVASLMLMLSFGEGQHLGLFWVLTFFLGSLLTSPRISTPIYFNSVLLPVQYNEIGCLFFCCI